MSLIKAIYLAFLFTVIMWGITLFTYSLVHASSPQDTAREIETLVAQANFNSKYAELQAFWDKEFERIKEDQKKDQEYFEETYPNG